MRIIKLLMCIEMLFVVACDSDDDGGGLAPTIENLQGTWDSGYPCLSGTYPQYTYDSDGYNGFFEGCVSINDCNDQWGNGEGLIIESNSMTWCQESEATGDGAPDWCYDTNTFILSGNTITIYDSYGDTESITISLSEDGGIATIVQSITEEDCYAIITQTWTKR